jgi:opacity protein-like surface antigen
MTRVRALVIGCMGAFAFVASAHAADPAGTWRRSAPEPEYEKPAPRYRELLSGWYFRGDLGYRWNSVGSTTASTAPTTSQQYGIAIAFGGGFGYKYQWFRTDVTLDRGGPSRITGTTAAGALQPQYSAKVTALSLLANVYIDLGTWAGFTPYVGAGAGVSRLTSETYVDTGQTAQSNTITGPGKAQNFSWAYMAGVTYQLAPSWILDVGFRHIELGDLPSANDAQRANNAVIFRKLSTQEARVGIRFLFD